jgi:uncharacterized Ntn-hydrolase superfamily protein
MIRQSLLLLAGLATFSSHASATWSIVCVNTRTREVGVSTATCLEDFNLRSGVPVIFVGEGAAAAQSFLDSTGTNRRLIYFSFRDTEETPAEILAQLAVTDAGHQTRQYGIVNFTGGPVTFTGNRAGDAATGVTGQIGDVIYAIQGNILTGDEVVLAAEAAFRAKKGDLGQKIMAGMEAARALGGDGRCSCTTGPATSCGVPPPGFTKSAHVGVVVIARVGDTNAGCNASRGCAGGNYYLTLNVIGDRNDVDPVFTLQERYDAWRQRRRGRPDGVLSVVGGAKPLPADGTTERRVTLELRDLDERPLGHGGALLEVLPLDGLPSQATVGPVTDLGDGRYTFQVRAASQAAVDRFQIRVTDVLPGDPTDVITATLYPPLEVRTIDTALYVDEETLSASRGGRVQFVTNVAEKPLAPYGLLATRSPRQGELTGLLPGGPSVVPIAQSPFFPAAPGVLDADGRGTSSLWLPAGLALALVGQRFEVTGFVLDGGVLERTNAVGLEIVP